MPTLTFPARRLVIEAEPGESDYWRDLWRYRELFCFLAWRDILVRYKQTVAGVAWAVLRPVITLTVFTVVFGKFAGLPSGGVPYPLLVLSALLPWQFFANALTESSQSLVTNANLISRIYFPRLIIPASSVMTSLIDTLISALLLLAMMAWYHCVPTWRLLFLPLFMFLAAGVSLGAGIWLAALTVKYRDFRMLVPFLVQIGFFISPVGYSSTVVAPPWNVVFWLNPMAGIIDGFRWSMLGGASNVPSLNLPGILTSAAVMTVLIISGLAYFRRTERVFADLI